MHRLPLILALLAPLALAGCGDDPLASIETFRQTWADAAEQRDGEKLFDLLDARSRQAIEAQLNRLRGLDRRSQKTVIDTLGGDRIRDLREMSPRRYFGLWWNKATDERVPTMTIEAEADESATMVLSLPGRSERFALRLERGRWTWALPEQDFDPPPLMVKSNDEDGES